MLAVALTCGLALSAGSSKADTVPAMAGHGWPNHFDGCFGSSWQMMQNNCGVTRLLIIPAQGRYWGYNSVLARAAGNGAGGMTNCQGITTFAGSTGQFADSFTQIVSTNTTATTQVLNLGSLPMFPAGVMHYECFVAPNGGRVFSVDFE
jgi:hypothetical protein